MPPRRPRFPGTDGRAADEATRVRELHLWLTAGCQAELRRWATEQGLSLSAAAEALIALGLGRAPAAALGPALAQQVTQAVRADLGRYARLLAATALDTGTLGRLVATWLRDQWGERAYRDAQQRARRRAVESLRTRDALAELQPPHQPTPPAATPPNGQAEASPDDAGDDPDPAPEDSPPPWPSSRSTT